MKDRNMNQWVEGILADKKRIAIPIMTHPGIDWQNCISGSK